MVQKNRNIIGVSVPGARVTGVRIFSSEGEGYGKRCTVQSGIPIARESDRVSITFSIGPVLFVWLIRYFKRGVPISHV